ncbi:putative alpha crystallin/Hsp20 domain-containing protein [Helianthus debilis subsp. tardiflorus]
MYRKETAKSLHISLTPGLHKLDSLTGGGDLCISLNMPELGIEDLKSFFKHDTLFIQGKTLTGTDMVRYITGIRLPEFYTRNRSMIKEEMQDGMYKATIPFVTY